MAIIKFSDWKRAVFRCGKEIKGLRGGVHRYAAQETCRSTLLQREKAVSRWKPVKIQHSRPFFANMPHQRPCRPDWNKALGAVETDPLPQWGVKKQ